MVIGTEPVLDGGRDNVHKCSKHLQLSFERRPLQFRQRLSCVYTPLDAHDTNPLPTDGDSH